MMLSRNIILSVFLLTLFSLPLNAQTVDKQKYLAENHEVLSLDKPNDFKLFDKDFYANDLFLLGEMHGTVDSYRVQEILVDELTKKTNFKYYIIENTYPNSVKINKYLETGDEKYLDSVFESLKGGFGYSREYYEIYRHVYKLNQTLKAKDRIKFTGIDKFSSSVENLSYLGEILKEVNYKKGSIKNLDEVFSYKEKKITYGEWKNLFLDLSEDIKSDSAKYKKIFGKRFWEFEFIIENFANSFPINEKRSGKPISEEETDDIRDTQMAKNFVTLYKNLNLKNEKMFGFFGREHTYQEAGKRTNWMTARFKVANPKVKIATFSLRYMESNFMIPTYFLEQQFGTKQEKLFFYGGFQNDDSPFVKAVGIGDLNAVEPTAEAVLFKLNGKNSPYNSLPDLVDEIADGKATTDYFDYAILLRKSKPTTPISEK
ncbi:MAG: hypothetical protein ACR2J3_05770 [Aridibacter sp.]